MLTIDKKEKDIFKQNIKVKHSLSFYQSIAYSIFISVKLLLTKSCINTLAAGPWSMGIKWPALFTVFNSYNPTCLKYPATLLFAFHVLNNVFLDIIKKFT